MIVESNTHSEKTILWIWKPFPGPRAVQYSLVWWRAHTQRGILDQWDGSVGKSTCWTSLASWVWSVESTVEGSEQTLKRRPLPTTRMSWHTCTCPHTHGVIITNKSDSLKKKSQLLESINRLISLYSRPASSVMWVPGLPGLYSETPSQKRWRRGWRDGLVVKHAYCSYRGPEFESWHPPQAF